MDLDIGGGLSVDSKANFVKKTSSPYFISCHSAIFLSLGLNYTFTNQIMGGINLAVLANHTIASLPILYLSFPIGDGEQSL